MAAHAFTLSSQDAETIEFSCSAWFTLLASQNYRVKLCLSEMGKKILNNKK